MGMRWRGRSPAPTIHVAGHTRAAFILRGAFVAASVSGAAAVGPFVGRALAQSSGSLPGTDSDGDILRLALTLEFLEADFYRQSRALKLRPEVRALAELIGSHESEHVQALLAIVQKQGGRTRDESGLTFHFDMRDEQQFLKLAVTLEDNGVSAYNGAAPLLHSPDLLDIAGTIVQVEGRHASAVRFAAGDPPAPMTFDRPVTLSQATTAAVPFIKQL